MNYITNKAFWLDALSRGIFTFCEALLGFVTVGIAITDISWSEAVLISLTAFVATILKCICAGYKSQPGIIGGESHAEKPDEDIDDEDGDDYE